MGVVPKLGGDEQVLAVDDRGNDLLQGAADLVLVLVDSSKVKVAVTVSHGDLDLGRQIVRKRTMRIG